MKTIFMILSVVLALAMLASANADFRGREPVAKLMHRLGYRPGFERFLGSIKALGALGLFVGLFAHGIGVVAAAGLVLYFAMAIRAHVTIGDPSREMGSAIGLGTLSLVTLITGIAS